jgi:hypothetical protein
MITAPIRCGIRHQANRPSSRKPQLKATKKPLPPVSGVNTESRRLARWSRREGSPGQIRRGPVTSPGFRGPFLPFAPADRRQRPAGRERSGSLAEPPESAARAARRPAGGVRSSCPELRPMTAMPGQPALRRTGLASLPGAQRVKPLQCLGHGLDPDLAVVHPGTRLFRRS